LADFIKNIFGNQENESANIRKLNHATDLLEGDSVRFKLHAPPLIKEKVFKVVSISTYYFESSQDTVFVLQGGGGSSSRIFMSIENNPESFADKIEIRLSVMITHSSVRQLFDENDLSEVVDVEDRLVEVHRLMDTDSYDSKLSEYAGWTAPLYYREAFAVRGYHLQGDFRNKPIPQQSYSREEFDYYCLVSSDEKHVVEISVYNDNEDVMLTFVTDGNIIEELLPGD